MTAHPATLAAWPNVMAQLCGARLAVYDDLCRGAGHSGLAGQSEAQAEAVAWLDRHCLVWQDSAGIFHGRSIADARKLFERRRGGEAR